MATSFHQHYPHRRTALAATLALHLALLYCWQLVQKKPADQDPGPREAIQWLWLKSSPSPAPGRETVREPANRLANSRGPVTVQSPQPAAAPAALPPPDAPHPAPAPPSAQTILQDAKRAASGIYNELRKEQKGLIAAPPDSPQLRMQKTLAKAAELAPNKWYQTPKVAEIQDPGGYGRRRYRVIVGGKTYCVTYESNHAPDGLDTIKNGIKPKLTNCPEHEDVATKQEWRDP